MRYVLTPQSFCHAGASRGDITPAIGTYHRMWGAAKHDRSTGVHRPLTATVLALRSSDGAQSNVVVSLDHCILDEPELNKIRRCVAAQTSFREADVHIALTHTHGAGMMMRNRADLPGGDKIPPYLDALAVRVGELARDAEKSLTRAWISYGTGRCDLATHRDFFDEDRRGYVCGFNPKEPADDTLLVARVSDEGGRILATVVNYACHPTTLAWENTLISPDYLGAMREVIEGATAGAPCLFLQGASAELGPRDGFVGDIAVVDRNGRRLGYAALAAIEALPPAGTYLRYKGAVVSGAMLGTWEHVPLDEEAMTWTTPWSSQSGTVDLSYRPDLPTLDQTRSERQRLLELEQLAGQRDDGTAADFRAKVEQMTRQITRLESLPPGDRFPLLFSILRLGGAFWVFVAGEHYSALQTALRHRFPSMAVIVATIVDGWQPGYLPAAHTYGKGIYQEQIAMVAAGSLERVVEQIGNEIAEAHSELPK